MAARIKMVLEYDGTDFHGWQRQTNARTVQGTLEEALERITGEKVRVQGAGRTDAGVHAVGQVCSFDLEKEISPERLARALGGVLPADVAVRSCKEVSPSFHARFSARSRVYSYFVRSERTALWRRHIHSVPFLPDLDAMRRAAKALIGEKDFAGLAASSEQDKVTVCRLIRLDIARAGTVTAFHVEADHFLHRMVRTIVGTLLEVGRGRISPEGMEEILRTRDRSLAGPTLPPNGLYLVEVTYPAVK